MLDFDNEDENGTDQCGCLRVSLEDDFVTSGAYTSRNLQTFRKW